MSGITEGPWGVFKEDDGYTIRAQDDAGGMIAEVLASEKIPSAQALANANLIGAAPLLLAELKRLAAILRIPERGDGEGYAGAWLDALAAIKLAEEGE